MDGWFLDARYALRALRKRPLFTLVAAASLAIGVGANTTIFSVVNALLIQPPPGISDADRIVELGRTRDGSGFDTFSYPDFRDIRRHVSAFDHVSAWRMHDVSLSREAGGERVLGMFVSANYFETLGVRPALGRAFVSAEDAGQGENPVVILSHRLWRRLGADRQIIGQPVTLNRREYTVIGVAPEGFGGHFAGVQPQLWVPLTQIKEVTGRPAELEDRGSNELHAIARLAPGRSVGEADAATRTLFASLAESYPETNSHRGARVISLGPVPGAGRGPVTAFLAVLMTLVGLVLLVTCVNVAGMLLARSAAREKEIAIRVAVGAGRKRLVRQLLTESLAIFVLGGGLGILLAFWGTGLLTSVGLPVPLPIDLDFSPDVTVLTFALALTLLTGTVFGLIPAFQATRPNLVPALKNESAVPSARKGRLRRAFVAGQVAISLLLLLAAGLFLRSLQAASDIATGFDPEGVYMTTLKLELEGYREAERGVPFVRELLERMRGVTGIEAAAVADDLPLDFSEYGSGAIPVGWEATDERDFIGVDFATVSPGYFETLGIRQLRGRDFTFDDRAGAPGVAIVSRTFVDRAWPGEDPIGRRFRFGRRDGPFLTIVGVVDDIKNQVITETPDPFVYLPVTQEYTGALNLLARGSAPGAAMPELLRREIMAVDPDLSLTPVISVERYTAIGTLPQRLAAMLASALATLALLLSGLGIYGVVAYAVTLRAREIGIRMAVGADRTAVLRMIVKGGLALALPGLLIGAPLAIGLAFALRGFILGVAPLDPVALAAVIALMLGVITIASLAPARRASRVQPAETLRSQ